MPALLNRISTRPNVRHHRVACRLNGGFVGYVGLDDERAARRHPRPQGRYPSSLPTFRPSTPRRRHPLPAKPIAHSLPMPPPAPVTTATISFKAEHCSRCSLRHIAIWPPSTGKATPVIMRASSDTRKSAAAATSFRLRHAGERDGGAEPLHRLLAIASHAGQKRFQHRRFDYGGAKRVNANVLRCEFQREAAHEGRRCRASRRCRG